MNLKGKVKFVNRDKSQFFATIKSRVEKHFKENNISKYGNGVLISKTVVLLLMYSLPFVFIVLFQPVYWLSLLLWLTMGVGMAGVGMSVMHDANHGAYFNNKRVNNLMSHVLNLLGASRFNWRLQHNILHHTYTNITHMDNDIDDKGVLRFSPHTKVKSIHRLQWLFAFFLYGITTLYWVSAKDFLQYFRYKKNGVNANSKKENVMVLAKMITLKLLYFFIFFIVPVAFFHLPFVEILVGFLVMHFAAGVILTVTFQLAHSVEGTSHPLPNDNGIIENDWAIHQMNTTVNFARNNKLLSWYVGGLNFQVEHHLFPRISHVHYPRIAPIVKQTAEEFGIPYLENRTFGKALKSHIIFLKNLGKLPNINEAIA
jgi:linoleoyl-CoA desaturase